MASEIHKFTGKAAWAKVYDPEEFRGSVNWKINLYLDKDELAKRKKAGIQSKVYDDENGTYVTFKRPQTKLIKDSLNEFSPPKILNAEGETIVHYEKSEDGTQWVRVGKPVLIGNGSTVEVAVNVYDTKMGKGQRLESVRIIDLVEYESNDGPSGAIVRAASPAAVGSKTPWE